MKKDWWDKEFKTMVALGESTTAGGWASCIEHSWPSRLTEMINDFQRVPMRQVNVGIGSNVISTKSCGYDKGGNPAGIERLDKHVFVYQPDLLIVSYGLNDANYGTPVDFFCSEMHAMVSRVREVIQPLIVLLGPYYMYAFDYASCSGADLDRFIQFNHGVEKVAAETGCLFVDLLPSYRQANWLVHRDGIHANDLGHRIIANKVFEVLASNCSGLSLETKEMELHIPEWRDERPLQRDYGVYDGQKPKPEKQDY